MTLFEAPAKLNLSLLVEPPRSDGYHPLRTLVQTVEWCDTLEVEEFEEDVIEVEGMELDQRDNLVARALAAARAEGPVPRVRIRLVKEIPDQAGLGGGSADAAAMLLATTVVGAVPGDVPARLAPTLGSDVPLFLVGGTVEVSGVGEKVDPVPPLTGFAAAVVVPEVRLSTKDVYRRWDEMEGPEGETVPDRLLPPGLRDRMPVRNDLVPAVHSMVPEVAELMAELRHRWGVPVMMTGSGSACFGLFPGLDEAADAAGSAEVGTRAAVGVGLRGRGVAAVKGGSDEPGY